MKVGIIGAGHIGGTLTRRLRGTPVYGADLDADGVRRALSEARKERLLQFTAAGQAQG